MTRPIVVGGINEITSSTARSARRGRINGGVLGAERHGRLTDPSPVSATPIPRDFRDPQTDPVLIHQSEEEK